MKKPKIIQHFTITVDEENTVVKSSGFTIIELYGLIQHECDLIKLELLQRAKNKDE